LEALIVSYYLEYALSDLIFREPTGRKLKLMVRKLYNTSEQLDEASIFHGI
jgi:hypothetical protein